jgi:hypothetical protein
VILQGEAAEGVLDRLRVGVPRNAQDLVVVALLVGRDGGIPFYNQSTAGADSTSITLDIFLMLNGFILRQSG